MLVKQRQKWLLLSISHMVSMPTTDTWEEWMELIKTSPRIGSLFAPQEVVVAGVLIPGQCLCQQCMDAVQTVHFQ